MLEKLVRWLIFSVVIALLPLAFNLLNIISQENTISFYLIFSHGELLLVSAAITATAIGELVASGKNKAIAKLISGGCCTVDLIVASYWFSLISTSISMSIPVNSKMVAQGSIAIFLFSVLASGSCIALSEESQI